MLLFGSIERSMYEEWIQRKQFLDEWNFSIWLRQYQWCQTSYKYSLNSYAQCNSFKQLKWCCCTTVMLSLHSNLNPMLLLSKVNMVVDNGDILTSESRPSLITSKLLPKLAKNYRLFGAIFNTLIKEKICKCASGNA